MPKNEFKLKASKMRQLNPSQKLTNQLLDKKSNFRDRSNETLFPKDYKIPSYKNSSQKSDNETSIFINKAQYDLDKLLANNDGKWKRDSDIIKESLDFFQHKSRESESEANLRTIYRTSKSTHPILFDNQKSDHNPNSETSIKIQDKSNKKSRKPHINPIDIDSSRNSCEKQLFKQRNSSRMSDFVFGNKNHNSKPTLPQETIIRQPGNIRLLKKLNQIDKSRVPLPKFRKIEFSFAQKRSAFPISKNLLPVENIPIQKPMLTIQKHGFEQEIEEISKELGFESTVPISDILLTIRELKKRIAFLEGKNKITDKKCQKETSEVNNNNNYRLNNDELIDIYNNQQTGVRNSHSTFVNQAYEEKNKRFSRASLSFANWSKNRLSESANSQNRNASMNSALLFKNKENLTEKSKVFTRLSKIIRPQRELKSKIN